MKLAGSHILVLLALARVSQAFGWFSMLQSEKVQHISAAHVSPSPNHAMDGTWSKQGAEDPLVEEQIENFIHSVFKRAHMDIEAQGSEASGHADCIRIALRDLVPKCLGLEDFSSGSDKAAMAFTLLDEERRKYSIALSVCQFKAAYMEYPSICDNPLAVDTDNRQCLRKLHANPQWWTTFNGYYQSVGSLCLEQTNAFQRDRILSVYEDMTRVQEGLTHSVMDAYGELKRQNEEVRNTLELLTRLKQEMAMGMQDAKVDMSNGLAQLSNEAGIIIEQKVLDAMNGLTTIFMDGAGDLIGALEVHSKSSSQTLTDLVDDVTFKLSLGVSNLHADMDLLLENVSDRMGGVVMSAELITNSQRNLNNLQAQLGLHIEQSIDLVEASLVPTLANLTEQVQNVSLALSELSFDSLFPLVFSGTTALSSKGILLVIACTAAFLNRRLGVILLLIYASGMWLTYFSSFQATVASIYMDIIPSDFKFSWPVIVSFVSSTLLVILWLAAKASGSRKAYRTKADKHNRREQNERLVKVYKTLSSQV